MEFKRARWNLASGRRRRPTRTTIATVTSICLVSRRRVPRQGFALNLRFSSHRSSVNLMVFSWWAVPRSSRLTPGHRGFTPQLAPEWRLSLNQVLVYRSREESMLRYVATTVVCVTKLSAYIVPPMYRTHAACKYNQRRGCPSLLHDVTKVS